MKTSPVGRVLITGGAGFIGSHLAEGLHRRGTSVTVLDDLSTGLAGNLDRLLGREGFQLVQGSVLDQDLTMRLASAADSIFHLAAAVGVRLIVEHPLESLLTNIHGTENVLEAASRAGSKLLIASSSEIYGKSDLCPFQEDGDRVLGPPTSARWSYSTSKAVDEILAYGYHRQHGVSVVVARLFNTVGPRQRGQYGMVLPRFARQALRGEPLTVYGDGSQTRVFTDVGDVVEALLRLMTTTAAVGSAFNIASREEVSIEELALRIIARTGSPSTVVHIPYCEVFGDDFEDTPRRVADTRRLERATGFRCETSLDRAIDRVIEYERSQIASQEGTKEDFGGQVTISAVSR